MAEVQHVRGNQTKIPVREWNMVADATNHYQRLIESTGTGTADAGLPTGVVLAANDSGEACPWRGVVAIKTGTGVCKVRFGKPSSTEESGVYGIALEPIANGKLGRVALASGPWELDVPDSTVAPGAHYSASRDAASWQVEAVDSGGDFVVVSNSTATSTTPAQVIFPGGGEIDIAAPLDPALIGNTTNTDTAQTDTFDPENPPEGKDGVSLIVMVKMIYNKDGDQVVRDEYRTLTWPLATAPAISAGTQIEVNTPVEGVEA